MAGMGASKENVFASDKAARPAWKEVKEVYIGVQHGRYIHCGTSGNIHATTIYMLPSMAQNPIEDVGSPGRLLCVTNTQ